MTSVTGQVGGGDVHAAAPRLTKLNACGHGAGSDILVEQTVWSVARSPRVGDKADWIANFATEAEALAATGLGE